MSPVSPKRGASIPTKCCEIVAVLLVAGSAVAAAAQGRAGAAVAVAPGAPDRIVAVEDRCPTFHWGGEALQWELVVIVVGDDSAASEPVPALSVRLPGAARGWTPASGQCLDSGAYGWAVRAVRADEATAAGQPLGGSSVASSGADWSEPRYFSVSEGRDRELLRRLVRYLETRGELEEALGGEPGRAAAARGRVVDGRRARLDGGVTGENRAADPTRLAAVSVAVGSAPAALRGNGAFAGVVGSSDDPAGFGVGAMNLDPAGGADLVLDGSAQGLSDTWLSESVLEAGGSQFELRNSTSDLVLLLDGQPVVTEATDRDTLGSLGCGGLQVAKADASSAWSCAADEIGVAGNQLTLDGSTFDLIEGSGSGLDADLLDGLDESAFMRADADEWVDTVGDTMTGDLVMSGADLDLGVGDGGIVRAGTLFLHSRGDTNTALGLQALSAVTLGTGNTAVGFAALGNSLEGVANTAVGVNALQGNQGGANTAVGSGSMFSNTSGFENTAVGEKTLQSNGTGLHNTALGVDALRAAFGSRNTALGKGALRQVTGSDNLGAGTSAGDQITTGSHNVMIAHPGQSSDTGTIRIGNANQTRAFLAGVYGAAVDAATAVPVMVDASGQLGTVSGEAAIFEHQILAPLLLDELQRLSAEVEELRAALLERARAGGR